MRVVITGTSGQLGGELMLADWPVGLTPVAAGRDRLDLARPDTIAAALDALAPDLVINCAAYTAVDKAESEPELAYAVNAAGPEALAAACAARGVPLVQVSTDYVFDGTKAGAYRPDDPVAPLGVYGASKQAGEAAVRRLCPQHVILRISWVYSARGNNFVKTMLRLAGERDELRVVADQMGCPTATPEAARALAAIAARIAAGTDAARIAAGTGAALVPWGTYHFCGAGVTSWHGLAQAAVDLAAPRTGRRPVVTPIATADWPTPVRRPANSALDCTATAAAFGIVARPWRDALAPVVAALLEPPAGVPPSGIQAS